MIDCPRCHGKGFGYGYSFAGTGNVTFSCSRCGGLGKVSEREPERREKLRKRMEKYRADADSIEHRLAGRL